MEEDKKKIAHVMKYFNSDSSGLSITHAGLLAFNLNETEDFESVILSVENGESRHETEGLRKVHISNFLGLIRRIIHSDFDAVMIYHYYGSLFQLVLQLFLCVLRIPVIIFADFSLRRFNIGSFLERKLRNFIFKIQGFLSNRVWVPLEYEVRLMKNLLSIPKEKFIVIPGGFYKNPSGKDFEIGTDKKSNYILAVSGWWSDTKNLQTALEVFSDVLDEGHSDLEFRIVGEFHRGEYTIIDEDTYKGTGKSETGREYEKRIKSLVEKLGIGENVRFLGVKTGQELMSLYRKAKVYYLPTKNDLGTKTFIESMASGTPVVSRKNPGIEERVGDGVCGILRDSKEGQKKAILKLLSDDNLYQKTQKNCLKEAEKYRWEILKEKWKEAILNLVS